jgi:hemerythrin-like domain-containing protein
MAAGGLALAGCSKSKGDDEEVTANEDLMREHGALRRVLVVYREISSRLLSAPQGVDARAVASATELFRRFGEHYHEQLLEEQHIFPIVRRAGGEGAALVDALLAQHARGREITGYILDRTRGGSIGSGDAQPLSAAMLAFCRMYEAHASREDTIVFPAFKKALGEKKYEELGEQFEEIERKEFGGDGFDMALDKITAIERALGLSDLAGFTAPPLAQG